MAIARRGCYPLLGGVASPQARLAKPVIWSGDRHRMRLIEARARPDGRRDSRESFAGKARPRLSNPTSGELGEALRDPGLQGLGLGKGSAIGLRALQHLAGRGACAEPRIEVDER